MAVHYTGPLGNEPEKVWELRFDTEPIVGWRVWQIAKRSPSVVEVLPTIMDAIESGDASGIRDTLRFHLLPLATGTTPWPAGKRFEAECSYSQNAHAAYLVYFPTSTAPSQHEAPHVDCSCGAWAVREGELDHALQQYNNIKDMPFAWGEVHMWGHVVEAEKGFRARFAYPKNLTLVNATDEMEEDLTRLYQVPVSRGGWKKSWNKKTEEFSGTGYYARVYKQMTSQMMFGTPSLASGKTISAGWLDELEEPSEKKRKRKRKNLIKRMKSGDLPKI